MIPSLNLHNEITDIEEDNVTLTLTWEKPFNNFDPIVSYIVSYSSNVTCPQTFTTTVNTTTSYTITNLTTTTNYKFLVVATNSIGSGEAGVMIYMTQPGNYKFLFLLYVTTHAYVCTAHMHVCSKLCV